MGFQDVNYSHLTGEIDLDHDTVCMMQANQLLAMNCLEYEAAAYGVAYLNDDEIQFYISSKEETMRKFQQKAYKNGVYLTPNKYYCKRYDLINDSEEEVKQRFRIEVANLLYEAYPHVFFDALQELTATPSLNAAFSLMKEITAQLENTFDRNSLNIFGNLLELLTESRLLNQEAYFILTNWLQNEYEKMSIETIHYGHYKRAYSGFAYQKQDNTIRYFIDALQYITEEKQRAFIKKGYLVTPILTIQYGADSFDKLQKSRENFSMQLANYLNENYLKLMLLIKTLPTGIDSARYQKLKEQIELTGKTEAIQAFSYYGRLWNME